MSDLSKKAAKLLAHQLIEAAYAGSYSPAQAVSDELGGDDDVSDGIGGVIAALRGIAETGESGPTFEELAEALRSIKTHFLDGYSAVLPAQKSVIEEVRTLVGKLGS